ncbi:MAG: hypothetical protein ACM3ZT_00715 [Bacillota bacterium]
MGAEKKKIVVAGKSYASIEEMPAEVRRVYELAVETRNQEHAAAQVKLVFNGQEYESLDSMPPDVRKMYQTQQVAMETYRDFSVDATMPRAGTGSLPTKPAAGYVPPSFFERHKFKIVGGVVALLVILLLTVILL